MQQGPTPEQIGAATRAAQEHLRAGRAAQAANLLQPLMAHAGGSPATLLTFARSLAMLRQYRAAVGAFARACEAQPGHVAARVEFSVVLSRLGLFEEALAQARGARRISAWSGAAVFQEAELLVDLRRDDEALALLAGYEREAPAHERTRQDAARLCLVRGRLSPQRIEPTGVVEELLGFARDEGIATGVRCLLYVRAASLLDVLKRYDEAFEAQTRAKGLMRLPWDAAAHTARSQACVRAWTGAEGAAIGPASVDGAGIVFIVGMPRSGSTLLETMLARHPAVQALGERNEVTRAARALHAAAPSHVPMVADLSGVTADTIQMLAEQVRGSYEASRVPGKRWLVDKQPFNFAQLPLLARLLPGCRVIHATRDARDVCVSYYMQWFYSPHGQAGTIGDLGRFYRDYREMMGAWMALPAPAQRPEVLEVGYERLVAEPESVMRETLGFLGLGFDERVLAASDADRIANTASRDQVRSGLYGTRVARWRRYEKHLPELDEILGPAGEA